jgi:Fic family protein
VNTKDFRSPSAGKVIRTPTGYTAFIPAKLPPRLTYDDQFVLALSRADAALSELSGLGRHLPIPHLLIALYVRREAVLSSRIEGTRASLSDLLIDEMEEPKQRTEDHDVQEVQGYVAEGH